MAISSAVFGKSHQHIVTRGMDDTLKLFDVRSFKKPLKVVTNLPNAFDSTNTVFSPDERFLLTGVSIQKSTQESGKIVVFDSTTLEPLSDIEVGPSASVVKLVWHSRINQVFAGLSNGTIQALYNPRTSAGGVTLSLTKQIHRKAVDDISYAFEGKEVRPPSEDLQFPEERGGDGKRNFAGFKKKPKGSEVAPRDLFKPVVPGRGGASGQGGQIGTSVTAYMMKSIMKDKTLNDDPREAILKYAQVAEEDPYWVAPAYQKNQPVAQYSKAVYEDEDEAKREAKKKRRQ